MFFHFLINIQLHLLVIENLVCTRRAAESTAPVRSAHVAPGRATGTFPRARRGHARRWSMCGRLRLRRVRTHSCPAPRWCRRGCRCRSWPRTGRGSRGLDGPLSRPPSRISCRECCSCSRCCRSARCSSVNEVLKS